MSSKGGPRKTSRVDKNVMSETTMAPPDAKAFHGQRMKNPGARKEDWIGHQLQRVYDDALHESIPQDMLDLLNALDDDEDEKQGAREKVDAQDKDERG